MFVVPVTSSDASGVVPPTSSSNLALPMTSSVKAPLTVVAKSTPASVSVTVWPVAFSWPVTVSGTLSVSVNGPELFLNEPSVLICVRRIGKERVARRRAREFVREDDARAGVDAAARVDEPRGVTRGIERTGDRERRRVRQRRNRWPCW